MRHSICRSAVLAVFAIVSFSVEASIIFSEDFDGVVAPALPVGWTNTNAVGANPFVTSTTSPDSAPNDAFVRDPSTITDTRLTAPTISLVGVTNAFLAFRNNYILESLFDGGVLEASINGGAFADIVTLGGSFVTGGYNGSISTSFGNPLGGRSAWTGISAGGYLTTDVDLPNTFDGQAIQFRWRLGTDNSISSTGWRIDTITVTGDTANVPEPATLALLGLGLAGLGFSRRKQ